MKNQTRYRTQYLAIAILSLIALAASIIILVQKYTQFNDALCTVTQSNCSAVQQSIYATTFGLDNAWYGIVGFTVLGILALLEYRNKSENRKNLILAGSAFAGIAAIYFLFLQFFVIHATCIYCLIVDVASLITLGLGLTILLKRK